MTVSVACDVLSTATLAGLLLAMKSEGPRAAPNLTVVLPSAPPLVALTYCLCQGGGQRGVSALRCELSTSRSVACESISALARLKPSEIAECAGHKRTLEILVRMSQGRITRSGEVLGHKLDLVV